MTLAVAEVINPTKPKIFIKRTVWKRPLALGVDQARIQGEGGGKGALAPLPPKKHPHKYEFVWLNSTCNFPTKYKGALAPLQNPGGALPPLQNPGSAYVDLF